MKLRLNIRLNGLFRSKSDEREFLRRLEVSVNEALAPYKEDVQLRTLGIGKLKGDNERDDD